jgi:hypothetical protein
MRRMRFAVVLASLGCCGCLIAALAATRFTSPVHAADAPRANPAPGAAPAPQPNAPADAAGDKVGRFPHVTFNVTRKQVRVECEALAVNAPLEFFCCLNGTNEHEAVLRTPARPSDIHTALLAIGLKPGQPMTYVESTKKWLPPQGPPLHVDVEFEKGGKTITYPAYRWIREIKSKKEPKAFTWVFCGSRVMKDGRYAADDTGYVMSLVNFDYTLIDIPELASSSNETLEWERNPDLMPDKGTRVWMVIEPAGKDAGATTKPAGRADAAGNATGQFAAGADAAAAPIGAPATQPAATAPPGLSDVHTDEAKVQALLKYHDQVVGPRAEALRQAAQAHYDVIQQLRKEQQRLITEADLIQRTIDELEKKYTDLTTPAPALEPPENTPQSPAQPTAPPEPGR